MNWETGEKWLIYHLYHTVLTAFSRKGRWFMIKTQNSWAGFQIYILWHTHNSLHQQWCSGKHKAGSNVTRSLWSSFGRQPQTVEVISYIFSEKYWFMIRLLSKIFNVQNVVFINIHFSLRVGGYLPLNHDLRFLFQLDVKSEDFANWVL